MKTNDVEVMKTYKSRDELLEDNIEEARELCRQTSEQLAGVYSDYASKALNLLLRAAALTPKMYQGLHLSKIKYWSKILGIDYVHLFGANLSYEISQMSNIKILGCSSAVIMTKKYGPVHVRNMDWDSPMVAETSAIIENSGFMTVSNPGLCGTASGMAFEKFSITLNWAPPQGLPRFGWSPMGLIQWVLGNCETYAEAVDYLSREQLNTPALFTVVGMEYACVVERTPDHSEIRHPENGVLVTTNHYMSENLIFNNPEEDEDDWGGTFDRFASATERALKSKTKSLDAMPWVLGEDDNTLNECTVQRMVLCPRENYYCVESTP